MTPARVTITLPIPDRILSPNARPHWAAKAKRTKAPRWMAEQEARAVRGADWPWPFARVSLMCYWPTLRFWDDDNISGACKAYRDGVADAGLVTNDKRIRSGSVDHAKDKANPRVEMTFTREDK